MVTNSIYIDSITINEIDLLKTCLENLGDSKINFRYFDKRPFSIIQNHLVTAIMIYNGEPVGYGHLDKENNVVWLGIAIAENFQGKGLGKKMMYFLLDFALKKGVHDISLTVDEKNFTAIRLYENFGFSQVKQINKQSLLMHYKN